MKKILVFLLFCMCLNVHSQTLSEIAQEMNKRCPVKQGGIIEFSACHFSQNTFVMDLKVEVGNQFDIKFFNKKQTEGKEWFKIWLMYIHRVYPYICNRAILKNVNIKINVKDLSHSVSHSVVLTPRDIQNAINKYGKLDDNELALVNQVVSTNIQTPLIVDEITTLTGAVLTPSSLQFDYTIEDSEIDMETIQAYLKENRADILNQYSVGYAYESIVGALVKSNRSFILLYKGKYSKKTASLSFNPRELDY